MCGVGWIDGARNIMRSKIRTPGQQRRRRINSIERKDAAEASQYRSDNPLPSGYGPGVKFTIPVGRQLEP